MKKPARPKRRFVFFFLLLVLITIDVVLSRVKALGNDPVLDAIAYESGHDDIDGYTAASIKTHVAIVKSGYSGLSFSKAETETLTYAEIREMVFKAIELDKHFGTSIPELKYKIENVAGGNAWVSVMPNLNSYAGTRYAPGDQTDPRILWALLDYLADSTSANRISFLAGGSYGAYADENDIFNTRMFVSYFTTNRIPDSVWAGWNHQAPGLPDSMPLQAMVDSARARHPGKTIEWINTNYNEIMTGGVPYNELDSASRIGKTPEYYAVPAGLRNLSALTTSNALADAGKYNPTDAVLNCDVLVNVPVAKITGDVHVNCVMKNYIGSVSRGTYGSGGAYPMNRASSLDALDHGELVKTVINLFSFHPCDYTLVDGLGCMEGEGSHPWSNRTAFLQRNFVMAGADPVAMESMAAAGMNLNPNDIDMIRWACAKGYGVMDLRRIAVYGSSLADVRTDVLAAVGGNGVYQWTNFNTLHYLARACRRWLVNGPYSAASMATEFINEAAADARPGDSAGSVPWRPYYSPGDYVNLTSAVAGTTTNSVVYAFTQMFSDSARSGLLYAGGVRDLVVYINGVKAVVTAGILTYSNVKVVKPVTISAGDNRILVKVRRSGTEYGFSLAVVNDGALSPRSSYRPHSGAGGRWLGPDSAMTDDKKRAFFGGRTLFGTFYHLGQSDPIGVEEPLPGAVLSPAISLSGPNPFRAGSRITFVLPGNSPDARLEVFSAAGEKVRTLYDGRADKGGCAVVWDGRNSMGRSAGSGVYFLRLTSRGSVLTKRMAVLR